jgi:ankyrin repeat protein
VVKILIDKGVNFSMANNGGKSPLHAAAIEGNIDVVEILINAGININAVDNNGDTALLIAIGSGHNKLIMFLINHGVDINLENHGGFTPLILAVWKNNYFAAGLLIKKGSDVLTKRTKQQFTPLQVANNSKSQFDLKLKNIDRELENIDRKIREAKSVQSKKKAKELTKMLLEEAIKLRKEKQELTTQADVNDGICLMIAKEEKKQLQALTTAEPEAEPLVVVETLVADPVGQSETELDAIKAGLASLSGPDVDK